METAMQTVVHDRGNGRIDGPYKISRDRREDEYPARLVNAEYDPATQYRRGPIVEIVDGEGVVTYTVEDKPAFVIANEMAPLVNAERDRRIRSGFTFDGVRYQSDDQSRTRIEKSRGSAFVAVMMGGAQPDDLQWHGEEIDFFWIAEDDTRVPMDAQTMIRFGNLSTAREGTHIAAGSDIKQRIANGETKIDITDDALWPE